MPRDSATLCNTLQHSATLTLEHHQARLSKDAALADAVLANAHKVTWDYDVLEAEANKFVAACVARDAQRCVN